MTKQLNQVVPGDTVCEAGRGTANLVHRHRTVKRVTKTMIVTGWIVNGRQGESRFNREHGHSVPYSDYGGSSISTTCQRKAAS